MFSLPTLLPTTTIIVVTTTTTSTPPPSNVPFVGRTVRVLCPLRRSRVHASHKSKIISPAGSLLPSRALRTPSNSRINGVNEVKGSENVPRYVARNFLDFFGLPLCVANEERGNIWISSSSLNTEWKPNLRYLRIYWLINSPDDYYFSNMRACFSARKSVFGHASVRDLETKHAIDD